MRPFTTTIHAMPSLTALLAAGLLAPGVARAQIPYKIQPIVKHGDMIAGVAIRGPLHVGTLNDQGQLVLVSGDRVLGVYSDGTFTLVVVRGQEAPGGKWHGNPETDRLAPMNQRGNVAFDAFVTIESKSFPLPFLWDAQTRKVTAVVLPGMPAVNNLTFLPVNSSTLVIPAINNQDEIAFAGHVADTAGKARVGVFFLGRDRTLRSVLLPDQDLPGGGTALQIGGSLALTDAGVVAFRARRPGDGATAFSAYQWENGVVTPLALVGADAPGGGKIMRVSAVRLNNRDRSALLALQVSTASGIGLYRLAEGQLTPVAAPGQEMPGGGRLLEVPEEYQTTLDQNANGDISRANEAGQFLFRARLEDGTHALYRLDPDNKLTFLLKQGSATESGEITRLIGGGGIGFNSRGQIALVLRIAGGPPTLMLLTPKDSP